MSKIKMKSLKNGSEGAITREQAEKIAAERKARAENKRFAWHFAISPNEKGE